MSVVVNVHAAKTQLSRLLDAAAAAEEVIIAKAGKPAARLVPITDAWQPRRLGTLAGKAFQLRKYQGDRHQSAPSTV